ncbi:MAG: hypothetical protein DI540_11490 [Sphingobium sp.]|nr:MAG: hypothetical protein DI540_11490 [Sphingobium sp.]
MSNKGVQQVKAPILSEDQFAQVEQYVANMQRAPMYKLMLLLTRKLGLRPIEIANMQSDWFCADMTLRIPQGSTKRQGSRSLPVNIEILDALRFHMGNKWGQVFTNAQGEAFTANGISEAMRRIYRLSGIKGSAYCGRRTAATNMVDKGISIRVVQEFLGHRNLATTEKYCSVTPNMLRNAVFG